MLYTSLTAVLALAGIVTASPAPDTHVLHEKRNAPDGLWSKGRRIDKDTYMPMRIGLTQSNLEKGHDYVVDM